MSEGDDMDPRADRRLGDDRRHGGPLATTLKVLGSPVSIIVLFGTIMLTTINVVQRADHAVQQTDYDYDRKMDAILLRQALDSLKDGVAEVNFRVIDLSDAQKAERSRSDSVIRLLRRTICRTTPDDCP
jgi:hypothetical protein